MLEVDGSYGEGGGQILRSAVALSSLMLKPFRIFNIRAKRSNPGLRPQHIAAIKAVAMVSDANVKGLSVGSSTIEFYPRRRKGGSFNIDVGTAGSISLVLQALLPASAFADSDITIRIRGGTDVRWSPTIDYVKEVLAPILGKMGFKVEIEVPKRGFYPKGGGEVVCKCRPVRFLRAVTLVDRGELYGIKGKSLCCNLPRHVAERQAKSAARVLREHGYENTSINIEHLPDRSCLSPGSSITLWAVCEGGLLGADALGERGKPAEKVGEEAGRMLVEELRSRACVDRHCADMLIPYMAIAKGKSEIRTSVLTLHTKTNIWLTEMFTGAKFSIREDRGTYVISVDGLGLENESL